MNGNNKTFGPGKLVYTLGDGGWLEVRTTPSRYIVVSDGNTGVALTPKMARELAARLLLLADALTPVESTSP